MGILAADNNVCADLSRWWPRAHCSWSGSSSTSAPGSATGKEPLLSTTLFRNRTSNLGLVTQNVQWLLLMGTAFVVSAYLQVVRGYNAIQTGVIFTAATVGILVSSLAAERLAKRYLAAHADRRRLRHDDRRDRRAARAGDTVTESAGRSRPGCC